MVTLLFGRFAENAIATMTLSAKRQVVLKPGLSPIDCRDGTFELIKKIDV